MPLLQGCPKDSLASLEGAQNTHKAVVMCVRYRFSKIKLSGKVSSLEMPMFQAVSLPSSTSLRWNTRLKEACE